MNESCPLWASSIFANPNNKMLGSPSTTPFTIEANAPVVISIKASVEEESLMKTIFIQFSQAKTESCKYCANLVKKTETAM